MGYPSYQEVQEAREQLYDVAWEHWLHHDVLAWQWWVLLAASILPWWFWHRFIDKQRRLELFAFSMLYSVTAIVLDVIGVEFLLWGYPTKLLMNIPPLLPADITLFPVVYSLLYQAGGSWFKYIWYVAVVSAFFAFIMEPILIWADMYENSYFPHWMSFLGFILVAVFTKRMIGTVKK